MGTRCYLLCASGLAGLQQVVRSHGLERRSGARILGPTLQGKTRRLQFSRGLVACLYPSRLQRTTDDHGKLPGRAPSKRGQLFVGILWGLFRATLGSDNPLYSLAWSRGESLVSLLSLSFSFGSFVCLFLFASSQSRGSFLMTFVVKSFVMFQSLVCQGLFPRVLRTVIARIGDFRSYSIVFVDRSGGKQCLVRTWEKHVLLEECVDVQSAGQRVPLAELISLACVLGSVRGGQLPWSVEGASPSLLQVLSDAREDGHQFVLSRNITEEVFLSCYRQAHHRSVGHDRSQCDDRLPDAALEGGSAGTLARGCFRTSSLCCRWPCFLQRSSFSCGLIDSCVELCEKVCPLHWAAAHQE